MRHTWILLFCSFYFVASAQQKIASGTELTVDCKSFFATEEPLEMILTSDFKKLKSQKKKDVFQPAYAVLKFTPKDSLADSVRIAARGEFRREQCQMPSLMINFKNKKKSPLHALQKMKMVCGCSSSPYNERLVFSEFLAYKIYNQLTDYSFRVRLVRMTYMDSYHKIKPYSQYAFLIEDVDEMAKRNGCREYEKTASSVLTNRSQTTTMAIFQFMIGNLDWSVPNYHNVKLIQPLDDTLSPPIIVPYDFDFSGLVNASYAFPNHEMFAVEKVTDRFYRGLPRTEDEIEAALHLFRTKKKTIIDAVAQFELLRPDDRETMINYLEDFYKTVDNKRFVQANFVKGMK